MSRANINTVLLAFCLAAISPLAATASVPLRWTVETSRVQPAQFEAYHGETLNLEAALQSYGKPLAADGQEVRIYWQTNGMGSAYWSSPAASKGNVLQAYWTPEMDTGASVVNGFIGAAGEIYRAAFQLRLRPSPGASPGMLELPTKTLDFATVAVENAPYYTKGETDAAIEDKIMATVDKAYVEALGITGGGGAGETDFETFADVVFEMTTNYTDRTYREKDDLTVYEWQRRPPVNMGGISHSGSIGLVATDDKLSKTSDLTSATNAISADVRAACLNSSQALAYASGVYSYMTANTNAWFAGTNYIVNAEQAAQRRHFALAADMDLSTVPCSMALYERRDGEKVCVWDQRDWTAWYWDWRGGKLKGELSAIDDALADAIAARAPAAWSERTAATGLVNPDRSQTWIDTPSVTLAPGMAWETVATVDGCGYWTIVGNGAVIGGSASKPMLSIKDFEGKEVMRIRKGESYQAYLNSTDYTAQMIDAQKRVCFEMVSSVQPIGEYTTDLSTGEFVAEDDPTCPADHEWEDLGNGRWRIHFRLKSGINAQACFAKFKVDVEGQTEIEYTAVQKITGGLIFNGVKIAPEITGGESAGMEIKWKVVR